MRNSKQIIIFLIPLIFITNFNCLKAQSTNSRYIITKDNGRIIKVYNAFGDFLDSDKSWESYKKILFDAYPEMKVVHDKQLSWGSIDSLKFPDEVKNFRKEDWQKYFTQYDDITLNVLYDSVITNENKILKPVNNNPIDLCLFLPYGGCFVNPDQDKSTIYISLLIDPADAQKIMVHEYAHNLHTQRFTAEPFRLAREIVAEGIAVYLTTLTIKDMEIYNAIPFMPESSVKWCFANEPVIKNSIKAELNDNTLSSLKKFIADGAVATPPAGFVEKTGYFAGYRIIEACIKNGMTLEDICSSNSDSIIKKSGYFK
jgi:uncharacterized protein YjaZ